MSATVERAPTPEQHAAIEAPGLVFVSAGAGTGKTTVLVERFVRAVDSGIDVASILVITYTDRAAAELRTRIRARLAELGRPELTRDLDSAWISTIHGFCLRLLKQYPFAAGLDPRFRVLDESQGAVLRVEAFDEALTEFCAPGLARDTGLGPVSLQTAEPERLALLATYGSRATGRRAGCCAHPPGTVVSPATRRATTSAKTTSGRRWRRPRRPPGGSSRGSARATCATTRARARARRGASWDRCAG